MLITLRYLPNTLRSCVSYKTIPVSSQTHSIFALQYSMLPLKLDISIVQFEVTFQPRIYSQILLSVLVIIPRRIAFQKALRSAISIACENRRHRPMALRPRYFSNQLSNLCQSNGPAIHVAWGCSATTIGVELHRWFCC